MVYSCEPPLSLVAALDAKPIFVGRSDDDYLIEVVSEDEVKAVSPDFSQLIKVTWRGVIVTALSTSKDYEILMISIDKLRDIHSNAMNIPQFVCNTKKFN
jgi:hypothetical protein